MKNPELFHKTVGILAKAYLKGELEAESCCACAVGNLVAANCGYKIVKDEDANFIWLDSDNKEVYPNWRYITALPKHDVYRQNSDHSQVDATGYTPEELDQIEFVFMDARIPTGSEDDGLLYYTYNHFQGMMNVVDYLMVLHEATEDEVRNAKDQFIEA